VRAETLYSKLNLVKSLYLQLVRTDVNDLRLALSLTVGVWQDGCFGALIQPREDILRE